MNRVATYSILTRQTNTASRGISKRRRGVACGIALEDIGWAVSMTVPCFLSCCGQAYPTADFEGTRKGVSATGEEAKDENGESHIDEWSRIDQRSSVKYL